MRSRTGIFAALWTLLVAALLFTHGVSAQELAGTWQGKLQVDPKTAMTIQFTFAKKADGSYSAVLNSPDNSALKNMAADSVTWKGGALSLKVAALSGGFDGTLQGGTLSGQWKQPGGTLPLVLSPYQKPVLSKAAVATLTGTWSGPLTTPGGTLTFVVRFKPDDKGEFQGTLAVPEQGGAEIPMSDIEFAANKLTFRIALVKGVYEATLANDTLTGLWRQGEPPQPPAGFSAVLKKGDYVAKVIALKMPGEAFGKLAGAWKGDLHATGPQGPVTIPIVLRFETNAHADMVAFMDIPIQKVTGVPITEATLTGDKVVIKIGAQGEYDAVLSANTLTGDWKAGPQSIPMTMTRKQ
jgi:hypothetical protein